MSLFKHGPGEVTFKARELRRQLVDKYPDTRLRFTEAGYPSAREPLNDVTRTVLTLVDSTKPWENAWLQVGLVKDKVTVRLDGFTNTRMVAVQAASVAACLAKLAARGDFPASVLGGDQAAADQAHSLHAKVQALADADQALDQVVRDSLKTNPAVRADIKRARRVVRGWS